MAAFLDACRPPPIRSEKCFGQNDILERCHDIDCRTLPADVSKNVPKKWAAKTTQSLESALQHMIKQKQPTTTKVQKKLQTKKKLGGGASYVGSALRALGSAAGSVTGFTKRNLTDPFWRAHNNDGAEPAEEDDSEPTKTKKAHKRKKDNQKLKVNE